MTTFVGPIDATERVLADGSIIEPLKPFTLDAQALKEPHNKRLIEEGQLIELIEPSKTTGGSSK